MDSIVGEDPTLPLDFSYSCAHVDIRAVIEIGESERVNAASGIAFPDKPISKVVVESPVMYTTTQSENTEAQDQPETDDHSQKTDAATTSSLAPGPHFISGRMSPSNNRNMKDFATQISELKKENFSLKLRIFYMEERMMEQFSGDHDQLWKTNIELKVECDSLRRELGEKHDLLVKASNAVACMETDAPEETRKTKQKAEREMAQLRELMDEKISNAEKELQSAHQDSEQALEQALKLKAELNKVQQQNKELNDALQEAEHALDNAKDNLQGESSPDRKLNNDKENDEMTDLRIKIKDLHNEVDEKSRTITQLQNSLTTKQSLIEVLNDEKETIALEQVQPLVKEVEQLTEKLKAAECIVENTPKSDEKSQQRYQDHITEQQQRLDEFELATRQMSDELDKREIEVKDLKEALKDAEETVNDLTSKIEDDCGKNKDMQEKASKDINKRDRALTAITMAARKKDEEINSLTREIDELKLEVDSLKFDVRDKNAKAEKMMQDMNRIKHSQIETSPSKDSLLLQLRDQLKESDAALQALREEKDNALTRQKNCTENDRLLIEQVKEQLDDSSVNLQTQQNRTRQIQEQLKETDSSLQDALDEKARLEDEHDKSVRDFNQRIREQNRQMERLKSQLSGYEDILASSEETSKDKDLQIQAFNTKLKNLVKELQDSMDEKTRLEDEHDKQSRDLNQQIRENNRQTERLTSQVADYEEAVATMDSKIKEKDWQLQEMVNKHKNLLKDLQQKEEERIRAILERDELLSQCEDEKNRFSTLANQMLRRTGSDVTSRSSSVIEVEALSRVRQLEDELFKKNQALTEATLVRDRAVQEGAASRRELNDALVSHDREVDENNRELGLKDVELRQLKDILRETEDKLHDYENEMRLELNKLVRKNSDLREKLRMSEDEICDLKSKSKRRRHDADMEKNAKFQQNLKDEVQDLQRQLVGKDEEMQKLRCELNQRNDSDEDDINAYRVGRNVTFNDGETQGSVKKIKKRAPFSSFSSSSLGDESDDDITGSDVTADAQGTQRFHRLRQVHVKNHKGNLTIDTTLGLPLDETSYMSIANGVHGNAAEDIHVSELKQILSDTRLQLSNAIREVADLKRSSSDHIKKIEELGKIVEDKSDENNRLMEEYNKANQETIAKESEIIGLLSRLNSDDKQSATNRRPVDNDTLRIESATESDSALSARSRRRSGDESDGMSSLSRRELCEAISHLKKKLDNAEKINDLLKQQAEDAVVTDKLQSQSAINNTQLVADLASEVTRLKSQLEAQHETREKDRDSPTKPHRVTAIPSKLPLPRNFKGVSKPASSLRPELDRARILNRKLNERLAATEQTVRMQADKLNRCRAAMRDAGIVSPPLSPIRAARSVPDLYKATDLYQVSKATERSRSVSADTNDASTQTADSGVSSASSPNSEQKFNSLIQAQAKELSLLREQLKKSRDTCKHLQTEMDMLSRYLSILSTIDNIPDPSMVEGIEQEIERSKKLVAKLRKNLADNSDDIAHSDGDSDSSVYSPLPLSVFDIHQLERLKNEVNDKNSEISTLKEKMQVLQLAMTSLNNDRNRLNTGPVHPSEKWLSTPNLHPHSTLATPDHASPGAFKKKPSSVGSPYQSKTDHGYLTPGSSHLSLHSTSEDEMKRLHDDSSRMPNRLFQGDNDDRYASLPSVLDKPQRMSWPSNHDHVTSSASKRRSMPMYQRTIAVTEYLPSSNKSDKGQSYSAASGPDETSSHHRRYPITSEASRCCASYGGNWANSTPNPQKSPDNLRSTGRGKPGLLESTCLDTADSSCDEVHGDKNHKLAREVDRLRRRLTDSKRINRTLKEELDLANKSLIRTRDSLVPGYQRSSQHDAELLAEHLSEIRGLRQRLEQNIATNDRLREKLENRLRDAGPTSKEHLSANIYLSPQAESKEDTSEIRKLQKKLEKMEAENKVLRHRLKSEEKAHGSYEDAIQEMKALQHHLVEKSEQVDRLTEHMQTLQIELQQQTTVTDRLGEKLQSRETDLNKVQHKFNQSEKEKGKLADENKTAQRSLKDLRSEVQNSRSQLAESRLLMDSLKSELALYEKLHKDDMRSASQFSSPAHLDMSELLQEIRSLRIELERSIQANAALRNQLEEQLKSHPGHDDGSRTTINIHHLSPRSSPNEHPSANRRSPSSARRKLKLGTNVENENVLMTPPASASSAGEEHNFNFELFDRSQAPTNGDAVRSTQSVKHTDSSQEKPFYSRGGPYTMCKTDDYVKLQQTMAKSGLIARTTHNKVAEMFKLGANSPAAKIITEVRKSTGSLSLLLDSGDELLRLFWPVIIPYSVTDQHQGRYYSPTGVLRGGHNSLLKDPIYVKKQSSDSEYSVASETDGLRREVGRLRRRLTTQDRLLQTTVERLHNTNKLKEGIEHAIVEQLTRTHDVLRKARGNLEAKAHDSGLQPDGH